MPEPYPSTPGPYADPLRAIPRRERIFIRCCMLAVAALAWAYLYYLDQQMPQTMAEQAIGPAMHGEGPAMQGMEMPAMPMLSPWAAADVFFTFVMWAVMMTGMMAGSVIPVVLLFAGMQARRAEVDARTRVLLFAAGYAIAWIAYSGVATLGQWLLHDAALLDGSMATSSKLLGGATLCLAGLYQLTPFKQACLAHCRSPLGFFMTHWREGRLGAVQMGLRHGAWCLGCCWALMLVLFVVGVMNLAWVALLTVFVLAEKLGPRGALVARVGGAAMLAAGLGLIAAA